MSYNINELGLDEFIVIHKFASEHDYDFHVVKARKPTYCWACGLLTPIHKHGSDLRKVRDINIDSHRVSIFIDHHRWKASECGHTFADTYESIDTDARITKRLSKALGMAAIKRPFEQVAEEFGVSPTTVERCFDKVIEELDAERKIRAPRFLGIDENYVKKGEQPYTVFVDLDDGDNPKLLEIKEGRSYDITTEFLQSIDTRNIEAISVDMYRQFHNSIRAVVPHAKIVADKFHVMDKGQIALDKVRIKTTKADNSRLTKHERGLIRTKREDLSDEQKVELEQLLKEVPQLDIPYQLKESFRDIFKAEDKQTALERFDTWSASIPAGKEYSSFRGLRKTMNNWKDSVFNYFDYPTTNARTEATNGLIKLIKKVGRGYSYERLRAKALYGLYTPKLPKVGEEERQRIYKQDRIGNIFEGWSFFDDDNIADERFGVSIPTLISLFEKGEL